MKKSLLALIALALLAWLMGLDKAGTKLVAAEPAADRTVVTTADPAQGWFVNTSAKVGRPAYRSRPAYTRPRPAYTRPRTVYTRPRTVYPRPRVAIGPRPRGHFYPYAGHPYPGGRYGPWARYWLGHFYHGRYYLYGVYLPTWPGYTDRVWNGDWLYWSPVDYCWYRFDVRLNVFIPLNPDGTDAIDTAPLPPPPSPPPPNG